MLGTIMFMGAALIVIRSIIEEGLLIEVIDNVHANLEIKSVIANESAQKSFSKFRKKL